MHVLQEFSEVGLPAVFDEETITAAVLGGVTATFPVAVARYGSGTGTDDRCSWGSYHKNRTGNEVVNESDRGADFALALWESDDTLRIAVFQAKRGKVRKVNRRYELDVHRRARKPEAGPWREPQMVSLVRSVWMSNIACKLKASGWQDEGAATSAVNQVARKEGALALQFAKDQLATGTWVHYVAYFADGARCIPLSALGENLEQELAADANGVNPVDVTDMDARSFMEVIRAGIPSVNPESAPGWLTVSRTLAEHLLPQLVDIMPVYEGKSGGGNGLNFGAGIEPVMRVLTAEKSSPAQITAVTELVNAPVPKTGLACSSNFAVLQWRKSTSTSP